MQESENETGFVVRDKRHSTVEDNTAKSEPTETPKAQAAEEKTEPERAPEQETASASARGPVDFTSFVLGMAQTALFQMGLIQLPGSEQPKKDMPGARQTIDIIAMIEEKTRGNLTDDEKKVINDTLFQLRMAFVEMNKL